MSIYIYALSRYYKEYTIKLRETYCQNETFSNQIKGVPLSILLLFLNRAIQFQ